MSSTTLHTFDLEAPNSRSSTECRSNPHSGLLKVPISPLLLVLEVCNVKPTYRKSCAANLLIVVRFDLGPLLQGQTRIVELKSAYNSLIIDPRGLGW